MRPLGLVVAGLLLLVTLAAAVLGTVASAASTASEPVVHVYDVQVTSALRVSSPSVPYAFSETSKWAATYKNVSLQVRTSEYGEPRIEMKMEGKGTVTGSIKYSLSSRHKSCGLSTNRPEPGFLRLLGNGYTNSGPGARRYRLFLNTGRSATTPPLRSTNCAYFQGNWAKVTGARVGPGGGRAAGYIDTRKVLFEVEFRTPQQPGQLGFPLNRLYAGAGFVLSLKGKSKNQSGVGTNEGAVRLTFVPRPS